MTRSSKRFRHQQARRPAAVVVALQEAHQSAHQVATSALELARLARVLGIDVVRTIVQSRARAPASSLLSEGKLRELAALTGGPGPQRSAREGPVAASESSDEHLDMVLVDGATTAGQLRTLELAVGVEVLDRTGIILQVFALRARSREARLQVALAEELYRAPRIREDRDIGEREGGGGRGGRGHTNVELAKQQSRARMAQLKRELATLPARAAVRRRRRQDLPQVALVGYTNAGKSSLMCALTKGQVHVADELFATVDLTVRAMASEAARRILVSDTVGFIANLPHELVASFRATLEEARHADLLLLVVDASDPDLHEQLRVTRQTLQQIGAADVPQQLVLNKIDRLTPEDRQLLTLTFPDAVLLSAHDATQVALLQERMGAYFERALVEDIIDIPYSQGELVGEIHRQGRVLATSYTALGTRLVAKAPASSWLRWRKATGTATATA
jgi:GTP-binding protein HflX